MASIVRKKGVSPRTTGWSPPDMLKGYDLEDILLHESDYVKDKDADKDRGGSYKKSGGGGVSVSSVSPQQAAAAVSALTDTIYAQTKPEQLVYTARTEDELRTSISEWLRPAYDQAILDRQKRTHAYRAELDADAIARGMGSSTYVSDVKGRQLAEEARDIASLESAYGAALAQRVFESAEAERERVAETAQFNAAQNQAAYQKAFAAAQQLYALYPSVVVSGGSGGGSRSGSSAGGASDRTRSYEDVPSTSPENCMQFLSILSEKERQEVYMGTTAQGREYRAELVKSLGVVGFVKAQSQYPARIELD